MKILKISFTNINNLKGDSVIHFDHEPLSSAGIFAITGPTGSGKSTILDVITLALFNRIPRFKSSISKSGLEGMGSVVTHHTDHASASIEYEIRNEKYTSSWTVGKTRTGNFKDYEMFIYDASGKPLDLKKSEVPAKNEEIIGLKYDQFIKSIILSQGQFSRFLKADKSERGQLLENLTGSSIYRKISIAAFEQHKKVKAEVELEKDRLQNIQVLTDEQRLVLSNEIEANEAIKKTLDKELEGFNLAKQVKTEIHNIREQLTLKQNQKEAIAEEVTRYKDKLEQLDVYDKLSPLIGDLTRHRDAKTTMKQLSNRVNLNASELKTANEERHQVMAEMSKLTGKEITVDNFGGEMSAFEKEINSLVQELRHIQNSGRETRARINSKAEKYKISIDEKAGPKTALTLLASQLEACTGIIKEAGYSSEDSVETIGKNHENAEVELTLLKELNLAYEKEAEVNNRMLKARNDVKQFIESEKKFFPLVKTSKELVAAAKENIVLLEKQMKDALLIAKLSDHRTQLVDGDPCPLCGALDHPYSAHELADKSDLAIDIETAKGKLKTYEADFENHNRKLAESQASKKILEEQIQVLETEAEKINAIKTTRYQAYTGKESKESEDIVQSISTIELRLKQLKKVIDALKEGEGVRELMIDFEGLQTILTSYAASSGQLKSKYGGEDISRDCNALQDRFVRHSTRITSLTTTIDNDEKALRQAESILQNTTAKVLPQIEVLGFESIEATESFIISEDELSLLKSKKEELAKKTTQVETEVKTLNENLKKNITLDKLPSVDLAQVNASIGERSHKKESLIKASGEKTAILQKDNEERERIQSKETVLKTLNQKLDKWSLMNKLIGESKGNKFANFAQGLTLQNLLVYANKRLQKLSDRYLLDKPNKDGALTVIDQYQGNIQRSVSTLSGGESFLISLALALSLSDMASKNVMLESLFIDEGFGTLDHESLDIAMNTLEKLQTESQKTVGVISHVEALKERIHVQIKLEKNAQGYGKIVVEG